MAVYYKPQSPIQSGEDFIYPITTADQVKVDKDTRLNAVGVYLKNIDNSTDTTVYGNNATTLGGVAAEDYALKTDTAPDSAKLGGKAPEEYVLDDDALTLEEIEASTDLTGKVASAEAAAKLSKKGTRYKLETTASSVPCDTWTKCDEGIFLEAGYYLFVCPFFRDQGGGTSIFKTNIALSTSETFSGDAHLGALSTDWLSHSMGAYVFQAKTDATVNIFVSHTSTVTHTIDIRTYFIRL